MHSIKKILIVDDHSIVSRGLHYIISLNFRGCITTEVSSIRELLSTLPTDDFTHLILDLNLEDGTSLNVLPQIIEKYQSLYILIYSMASEEIFAKKLLEFNISGFLSKRSNEKEVIHALQIFLNGGIYVSRNLKQLMTVQENEVLPENLFQTLSIAELKVLGMILKGSRTKEIANELNVTQQTIGTYKNRIFKKLGTENIFEIQKIALLDNINFS